MSSPADAPNEPARPRREPLSAAERWRVTAAAAAPIVLALVVLSPFTLLGPATLGEVVVAAMVYGGLLALASGFVAADRMQARQCPRCVARNPRRTPACATCGYDLVERPRFACAERHGIYLEAGLCDCGRRLDPLPIARGVGGEIWWMIKAGAWLLVFLIAIGLILQWTAR